MCENINEIEQLLKDCKYVIAVASVFDEISAKDNGNKVEKVYLSGYSSKKRYEKSFEDWNDGLSSFFHHLCVRDGKVYAKNYKDDSVELSIVSVLNASVKAGHREMKKFKEMMA